MSRRGRASARTHHETASLKWMRRAQRLLVAVGLATVVCLVAAGWLLSNALPRGRVGQTSALAVAVAGVICFFALSWLAQMALGLMSRALRNERGEGLKFDVPAWLGLCSWVIPLVHLVAPFLVLRSLWRLTERRIEGQQPTNPLPSHLPTQRSMTRDGDHCCSGEIPGTSLRSPLRSRRYVSQLRCWRVRCCQSAP
jgi:hypothetical protein